MDVFVCHSTLGTSTVYFKTLHLLWGWVQGSCVSRLVGSHRVLLVPLGVLGGELLPAAPLQPCAGAPSGRGHTIFWTVLTWPQDIMPASMSALQYRHEAPPRHGAMCRGPSSGGLSGRWVLSEPCQYLPCPISCHQPCCLLRTSSGERVRGVSGLAQNVLHRVLLVSLGVLGRELLPAAPLQPCAGAPSGRGHTIFWTVLTWPQDIMPASMSALQYRHEAPPRHGAMCRGPSSGGLSGRWVLSEPCQYLPCPILATNLVVCYVFFHWAP